MTTENRAPPVSIVLNVRAVLVEMPWVFVVRHKLGAGLC